MSKAELEDASNGIWMCYTHGKLIDTDEDTYTAEVLQSWKRIAELRAQISQQLGRDIDLQPTDLAQIPLPTETISLFSVGTENILIGDALLRCCVEQIWGKNVARAARDVLIELVRNAFTHGQAKNVKLNIHGDYIELVDDGKEFNSHKLTIVRGGGALSLIALREDHSGTVVFSSQYDSGFNKNRLTLVRKAKDFISATPCSLLITKAEFSTLHEKVAALTTCDTVYLLLPQFIGLSDVFMHTPAIKNAASSGKSLVLIGYRLSERVINILNGIEVNVSVLNFES